jgi:hypothetical protein
MKYNTKKTVPNEYTHEGMIAAKITKEQQLQRSVCSCFLGENEFYENGELIFSRIYKLALEVSPKFVAQLAIEARHKWKLRSVPLLLLSALARTGSGKGSVVADTIDAVITRPDQMCEFLAVHAKANGVGNDKLKGVLSAQMKKGLAKTFTKFDEYQLAKYNRNEEIKLKDVLFLSHAKPISYPQMHLWGKLINDELSPPDTWEVLLSSGKNKKETWERLLMEEKLGYLALLRNLRNMTNEGVDKNLMRKAILARKGAKDILPFRYIAAARACPMMEPELDLAMQACMEEYASFGGETIVLVDVSGSMNVPLSAKSDLKRMDAAASLAALFPGHKRVFTFSNYFVEVPPRKGMAGVEKIIKSQAHSGTKLNSAIAEANALSHNRLIIITDEQAGIESAIKPRVRDSYMINVASNKNGVGYGGNYTHIDGFSEGVFSFIRQWEENYDKWL